MYRSHAISMCGNCHLNNQINELPKFNKSRATSLWFYFNTSLKQLTCYWHGLKADTDVGTYIATSAVYFNLFPAVSSSGLLQSSAVPSSLFQSPVVSSSLSESCSTFRSLAVPPSH